MVRGSRAESIRRRWLRHVPRRVASVREWRDRDVQGFTLVELLIVITILPIIVGSISVGLISVFSLQTGVANRLTDSGDAQIVSANYVKDVQSATMITTDQSIPANQQCGTGTQLMGLEWGSTVVSYSEVPTGSTNLLVRNSCTSGASTTPTTSFTISSDLPTGQASPTLVPASYNASAQAGWISTQGVESVTATITEPGSNYTYTLVAAPRASATASVTGSVSSNATTTSCSFATPGTGTYASQICFVDWTPYDATQATSSSCQPMSAAIVHTPYTMTLNLCASGGPVAPAAFPTYFNPPTSAAFMGYNGFYTGVANDPALYQVNEGETDSVLTFNNIQVLDSRGVPASNWQLVTGDAESTDTGEWIRWSTVSNPPSSSDPPLNLVPNTPTSPVGNSCDSTYNSATNTYSINTASLTGLGTTTVQCSSSSSTVKTGTPMLEALTPTTLTVTMHGGGLEAMFFGLLLPS